MKNYGEKIVFGVMGAVMAVIIGLAVYTDISQKTRGPASSEEPKFEFTPYPYYFD